jgi:hypothetical protein
MASFAPFSVSLETEGSKNILVYFLNNPELKKGSEK